MIFLGHLNHMATLFLTTLYSFYPYIRMIVLINIYLYNQQWQNPKDRKPHNIKNHTTFPKKHQESLRNKAQNHTIKKDRTMNS
jgi:hypothetical protein